MIEVGYFNVADRRRESKQLATAMNILLPVVSLARKKSLGVTDYFPRLTRHKFDLYSDALKFALHE